MIVFLFAHIVRKRDNELKLYNMSCLSHLNILDYSLTLLKTKETLFNLIKGNIHQILSN